VAGRLRTQGSDHPGCHPGCCYARSGGSGWRSPSVISVGALGLQLASPIWSLTKEGLSPRVAGFFFALTDPNGCRRTASLVDSGSQGMIPRLWLPTNATETSTAMLAAASAHTN